jgi:undecaprenyl-diphosphatase
MPPSILQIALLAIIQGFAELLPVSSSAHVIIAEKLMGLAPATPEMMFLLIMLHTGTMGAVIVYFWKAWEQNFFSSKAASKDVVFRIVIASAITAVVGMVLKLIVEAVVFHNRPGASVEDLAANLFLMAASLAVAGVFIVSAGFKSRSGPEVVPAASADDAIPPGTAMMIGLVQGFCLPFRGLSRSGTTISTGMLKGLPRRVSEEFSFALAVVITPPIIGREFLRLYSARAASPGTVHIAPLVMPGVLGAVLSFFAGLLALRWLSGWLEKGRWHYFGFYCFAAAAAVCVLAALGY